MKRTANSLLVEIMIAVLCFALSATVILQTFVAARKQSDEAYDISAWLLKAQNLADRIYAADDPAALEEMQSGKIDESGAVVIQQEDGVCFLVSLNNEKTEAGTLRKSLISVMKDGKTLLELPCTRYVAEVQP